MKLLHDMTRRFFILSLFAAVTNMCIAQTPMMSAVFGDSDSPDSAPPVRIVEPADGATIHNNNGTMVVRVEERPALAAGTVEFLVDGHPVTARRDGDAFVVSGIKRGEHSLQAQSIGKNGETVQSDPIRFNLWQASALFRRAP